ncbi:MAG TPA: ATP synthase F1 subunit epsilon [Pirellulaceae bacterium]|nr:ATP synthase F1 subunit epsilon [Pirellulaceae bacterium]HMO91281.1 ATP synthase F1 subunit epsilon [Pirellulaceae bacterium]HMP68535.1 ATP synthase F1 subunit epsilon [Pirellulaceae bacterium]
MALNLSVVTPETTVINEEVNSVVVPLIDGEAGVLSGHAPTIGRLGFGVLRYPSSAGEKRVYIDGGFIQIANNQVNILTGRAIPVNQIKREDVEDQLKQAKKLRPTNAAEQEARDRAILQARAQLRAMEQLG